MRAARASNWTPKVLSEYEIAQAIAAIDAIALTQKPVAEAGARRATQAELEDDLKECLRLAGEAEGQVRIWIKAEGARLQYGFYRESWVLQALGFLDRADLSGTDRAWISGLLFGYRSDAIQQFIADMPPTETDGMPNRYSGITTRTVAEDGRKPKSLRRSDCTP